MPSPRDIIRDTMRRKQDALRGIPAVLGDINGNLAVSNKPGYVYARVGDIQVVAVYNNGRVNPIPNLPVMIGYDPTQSGVLQILSIRNMRADGYTGVSEPILSVYPHHKSHEWMSESDGNDTVFIWQRQLMPLRVSPAGGMWIWVHAGVIDLGGTVTEIRQTVGNNLEPYMPANTGKSKFVLVSISAAGVITLTGGAEVTSASLALTDIPAKPAGHIRLAAIRLYYNQSEIVENRLYTDIYDLRGMMDGAIASLHHLTHENGGVDEISVAGLSGVLADLQNPVLHHTAHENGGGDEISVAGLSGVLADKQDADKLQGRAIDSAAPSNYDVMTWDTGSSTWKPASVGASGAFVLKAGDTMTGGLVVQPSADTLTALVVNDQDANNVLTVDTINNRLGIGVTAPTARMQIVGFADTVQLLVKAHSTQTTNIQEWQTSAGTVLAQINGSGNWGMGITPSATGRMYIQYVATDPAAARNGLRVELYAVATASDDAYPHVGFSAYLYSQGIKNHTQPQFGCASSAYNNGSGTISSLIGFRSTIGSLSTGNTTSAYGGQIFIYSPGAGTITTLYGLEVNYYAATAVTMYGIAITSNTGAYGTSKYGLRIYDVSGAATNNYSVYTGAGLIHFGDSIDLASGKNITLLAGNIITDTTTGTKIGTAVAQKLGFWNATPIVQPAGASQAAPAAYATGAFGLDSDANMLAFYDLVVAMRTALVNSGIMKGGA